MRGAPDNREQDGELEAPEQLVRGLKRIAQPKPFIPPAVDEALLRAARRRLTIPERRRPGWLRVLQWGMAAAACLLLALWAHLATRPTTTYAREDLNRDGQVDILDAFTLAKGLHASDPRAKRMPDVNRDGALDDLDVRALAAEAVNLEKGGNS